MCGLLRRLEHVDAGGTRTPAWLDHDPSRMARHEAGDFAGAGHRREVRNPNACRLCVLLHQDLVAVGRRGDGVESGQIELAAQLGSSLDVDLGQRQDGPRPLTPGGGPRGVEHRVVVGVVGYSDYFGEPLTDRDTRFTDGYQ